MPEESLQELGVGRAFSGVGVFRLSTEIAEDKTGPEEPCPCPCSGQPFRVFELAKVVAEKLSRAQI